MGVKRLRSFFVRISQNQNFDLKYYLKNQFDDIKIVGWCWILTNINIYVFIFKQTVNDIIYAILCFQPFAGPYPDPSHPPALHHRVQHPEQPYGLPHHPPTPVHQLQVAIYFIFVLNVDCFDSLFIKILLKIYGLWGLICKQRNELTFRNLWLNIKT